METVSEHILLFKKLNRITALVIDNREKVLNLNVYFSMQNA